MTPSDVLRLGMLAMGVGPPAAGAAAGGPNGGAQAHAGGQQQPGVQEAALRLQQLHQLQLQMQQQQQQQATPGGQAGSSDPTPAGAAPLPASAAPPAATGAAPGPAVDLHTAAANGHAFYAAACNGHGTANGHANGLNGVVLGYSAHGALQHLAGDPNAPRALPADRMGNGTANGHPAANPDAAQQQQGATGLPGVLTHAGSNNDLDKGAGGMVPDVLGLGPGNLEGSPDHEGPDGLGDQDMGDMAMGRCRPPGPLSDRRPMMTVGDLPVSGMGWGSLGVIRVDASIGSCTQCLTESRDPILKVTTSGWSRRDCLRQEGE